MSRRTVPMQPRKVSLRGEVRWEVRIDPRLCKQEAGQVWRLFRIDDARQRHTEASARAQATYGLVTMAGTNRVNRLTAERRVLQAFGPAA